MKYRVTAFRITDEHRNERYRGDIVDLGDIDAARLLEMGAIEHVDAAPPPGAPPPSWHFVLSTERVEGKDWWLVRGPSSNEILGRSDSTWAAAIQQAMSASPLAR